MLEVTTSLGVIDTWYDMCKYLYEVRFVPSIPIALGGAKKMKLIVVILGGTIALTLFNQDVLGLTEPSVNDWISRVVYMLYGGIICWAARPSKG